MGLMRRVESSIEDAVGEPRRPATSQKPASRRDRGPALYVHSKELAQKLVKEMEDHKIGRPEGTSVPNRFTVYLCPQDYERYSSRMADLVDKLERVAYKHTRSRKYEPAGELEVRVVREPDLRTGYFGIQAERVSSLEGAGGAERRAAGPVHAYQPAPLSPSVAAGQPAPVHEMPARRGTQVIPAKEASRLGLVAEAIVLRAGNRSREFSQSRVVLGRGRDVDFRIDDANVSRRHAALYWSEGRLLVEDLQSTNGTLLNGQPVTKAALRSNDELTLGDSRVIVDIASG